MFDKVQEMFSLWGGVGGGGGIRTPVPHAVGCGFQDRRLQPLGHPSALQELYPAMQNRLASTEN